MRPGPASMRAAALGCLLVCCATAATAMAADLSSGSVQPAALDRLVDDVCDKQVVLLGEDNHHGSGRTLEIKVEIAKRLIEKCGFSEVLFESQVYDFLDLERSLAAGQATPELVADAIGGLWSNSKEGEILASFLFQQAAAGRIRLGGLDPQVGGAMQRFTQRQLPVRLASRLKGGRGLECESELSRLTNWRFDVTVAYDDAFRRGLRACLGDIQASIAMRDPGDGDSIVTFMATNVSRYLDMSSGNPFEVRDQAMFDNFLWYRERSPKDAKTIIWCATVHAVKASVPGSKSLQPLGSHIHRLLGNRAAAIGFSALEGSYGGRGRPPTVLAPAAPGSLEARAFAGSEAELRYLDRDELAASGVVPARAVNYEKPTPANWGDVLDGLLVLRRERPPLQ